MNSSPERAVVLTDSARQDLRQILTVSTREFGSEQARRYHQRFLERMSRIADFPAAGSRAEFLLPGIRLAPVGQHVLYYEYDETRVTILRILHRRMDPRRAFGNEED